MRRVILAAVAVGAAAFSGLAMAQDEPDGAALYANSCAGCHSAGGEGGYGPPLASNPFMEDAAAVVGQMLMPRELMPTFASTLSDEEIAAVVNFLRSDFNDYPADVDAAFVAGLR